MENVCTHVHAVYAKTNRVCTAHPEDNFVSVASGMMGTTNQRTEPRAVPERRH